MHLISIKHVVMDNHPKDSLEGYITNHTPIPPINEVNKGLEAISSLDKCLSTQTTNLRVCVSKINNRLSCNEVHDQTT